MGVFTAIAIAAAVAGAGAAISNTSKRKASTARNTANAQKAATQPKTTAASQPKTTAASQGAPAKPGPAGATGAGARVRPRQRSRSVYTSSLGLSPAARSDMAVKTLTGQ